METWLNNFSDRMDLVPHCSILSARQQALARIFPVFEEVLEIEFLSRPLANFDALSVFSAHILTLVLLIVRFLLEKVFIFGRGLTFALERCN